MAEPLWKLRSKHGPKKIFKSPKLLWEAACEYFKHTDDRKWIKKDWVGKDAKEVDRESSAPYTLAGLCLYLGVNEAYFRQFTDNTKDKSFSTVINQIKQVIYVQKFEGAAVGAFNANIISRDLGLKEHTQNEQIVIIPDITPEQRKKFKDEFNSEY